MEISTLLHDWFASEKMQVDPSLLAYVLLYSTRHGGGFQDIVKHLTNFWNQQDNYKIKCIDLLAQMVTPSQSSLDSPSNHTIIQFLDNRLQDGILLSRCIDIYFVLMHTETISSTDVIQICNGLFTKIKVRKLPQQSRFKVLTMIGKALEIYTSEIQRSKINFIGGFIHCMDGEKDPRNLLLAFDLIRLIIDQFDISQYIEDLFEIVSCYFPISFQQESSSDTDISTQDLKDSLRRCLACTPYFAYYATPLLIEKLLTTTGSAKRDAMETLSLCVPAYGAHVILPHVNDLFDALVREVYQGVDADLALTTIHHVVATLGTGISIANIRDPVEKAIDGLLQQCVQEFKEPELNNARLAASILRAAASASDPACMSVTYTAVPILCSEFKNANPCMRQKAILDILTELLMASKTLYGSVEDIGYDRDFQTPLLMYKQQILEIFVMTLAESIDIVLHQASLKGIHEMVLMKQFLNPQEINMIVSHLTRQLNRYKTLVLTTLGVVTKLYPEVIVQHTLPILLDALPCQQEKALLVDEYRGALEAIQVLGTHPSIFKVLIDPLLQKLDYACGTIGQHNTTYLHDLSFTLFNIYKSAVMSSFKEDVNEILGIGQKILLPHILHKCILAATIKDTWYLDDTLTETFAMMVAITTRLSTKKDQQISIQEAFQLFVQGDVSSPRIAIKIENNTIQIFKLNKENNNNDITLLFTAIVGNCYKEVELPLTSITSFLKELIYSAIQIECCCKRRLALSKLIASIINKWGATDEVVNCIKIILNDALLPTLFHEEKKEEEKRAIFVLLVWIIKSLVIRGHSYGFELLDSTIIKLCGSNDTSLGQEAACSFITLLHQEKDIILTRSSHAIVSILFKQRVFNHCFRRLIHHAEQQINSDIQVNYLLALAHLLQNVPIQIATNEISKLMLPIIVALSSHSMNLIKVMLMVTQAIVVVVSVPHQHVGSLIHALLHLSLNVQSASIRILALECLASLANHGGDEMNSFQPLVIKELSRVLDDKKRIVRKHAVDCREKWYKIGN